MSSTVQTRSRAAAASALLAALGAAFTLAAASAADEPRPPSPERGKAIAERLCSGCHLTGSERREGVPAGIPTFPSIANRADQTAARIRNVLIAPHAPMPDLQLTIEEIADIITWLDTFRPADAKRLLPRDEGGKPKYPEPT